MTDQEAREEIERIIESNPGVDTAYLVEATELTTRKVTLAINAIRKDVGLDSPRCIVSVKGKHYMPPALSEMGYRMQPNKKGTALLATPPNANEPTAESKLAEFKAIIGDRHDHEQILTLVWERYAAKLAAEEAHVKVCAETLFDVRAADAAFKETVEAGRENDQASAVSKLHSVEMAWQAWQERKSEMVEKRKESLDEKKAKDVSFLGLIQNLNQLEIVFGEEGTS